MPSDLGDADRILKDCYGPALEEQLRVLDIFHKLGWTAPSIQPRTRWANLRWELRHRLNDVYMHIRYGECDDAKELDEHIC